MVSGVYATEGQRAMLAATLRQKNALRIQDIVAGAPRTRKDGRGRTWRIGAVAGKIVRELVFYEGKGELDDFWIHKTAREWSEKIGSTPRELKTAVRVLVEEGLLETRPGYRPSDRRQTTLYKLNLLRVLEVVDPAGAGEIGPDQHRRYAGSFDALEGDGEWCCDDPLCDGCDQYAPEGPSESRDRGEGITSEYPSQSAGVPLIKGESTPNKVAGYPPQSGSPTGEDPRGYAGEDQHETPPAGGTAAAPRRSAPPQIFLHDKGWEDDLDAPWLDETEQRDGHTAPIPDEERHVPDDRNHEEAAAKEEVDEPLVAAILKEVKPLPEPLSISCQEETQVWRMVWDDPADGKPRTIPGRLALAHVCSPKADGMASVTERMVAEKVREALGCQRPVEAYLDAVGRGLKGLREELQQEAVAL